MDDNANMGKPLGIAHTKSFTSTTHAHNSVSFPNHPPPRMSYNSNFTNSNKDLTMHK